MKILIVDPQKCIGCGTCAIICPEAFEMGDDNKAHLKDSWTEVDSELVKQGAEVCPVKAISMG